ncbi:MAG: threonine--tRNA ligase [Deltaproteobacteria bacterium]|nr:threonine--tRNA ligase [Deltaproteobacteria bacterium]
MDIDDHRQIGRRLDLFHLQEEAPGMVFWHPRGFALLRALEERVRAQIRAEGYGEVRTPQLLGQKLWELSGHWQSFREDMFVLNAEERAYALKPVSCPGHIQIVARDVVSYRALPLRLAELGVCHRAEASGSLMGLFRLRQFTQDDGHIFCREEDVPAEIVRFCRGLRAFYADFGFDRFEVSCSLRPEKRAGSEEVWDRAESVLLKAAEDAGLDPAIRPGQGAFYGPKLEFALRDRVDRAWQCGTIQLDYVLPERFDLCYSGPSGDRPRMVMLHRALLGSFERFMAVLLEHHHGVLPAWLAPVQVVVAPIGEGAVEAAEALAARLGQASIRAVLDRSDASLARRVRESHEAGAPIFVAIGPREVQRGEISIRRRGAAPEVMPLDQGIQGILAECRPGSG